MDPDQSDSTKREGEGFLINAARWVGSTLGMVVAKTGLAGNKRKTSNESSRGKRRRQKSRSSKKAGVRNPRARTAVKKSRAKRSKAREG